MLSVSYKDMEFKYLICLFFTTCRVSEVLSLTCFQCNSDTTQNCRDPFSSKGVKTIDCTGFCTKSILDGKRIARYCIPEYSVSDGDSCLTASTAMSFEELCLCNANLCNAAVLTSATWTIIDITAILFFNQIVYLM
ncbi:uncharacterized protein LOC128221012 [Mya arenaria]|uniref:uncharacterized protein LOC128221012 n=1 Tax=Mya arenaria TaxID=6604 RepID=UPI0022DFAA2C|nr:uncharacterized protein LOC128221012 [Mya arenaria]